MFHGLSGRQVLQCSGVFGELEKLHGDKAVWKLLDRLPVLDVPVPGPVPRDVDTWEDYAAVLPA